MVPFRRFSRFYEPRRGRTDSRSGGSAFKTYTVDEIEEQGLMLPNGLADLPKPMQERLRAGGISDLFPVQGATFHLFVQEQNELIVK